MLIVLKKTYTITLTIQEGDLDSEFWRNLANKSGCDEVVAKVKSCLAEHACFGEHELHDVRLTRFTEEPPLM